VGRGKQKEGKKKREDNQLLPERNSPSPEPEIVNNQRDAGIHERGKKILYVQPSPSESPTLGPGLKKRNDSGVVQGKKTRVPLPQRFNKSFKDLPEAPGGRPGRTGKRSAAEGKVSSRKFNTLGQALISKAPWAGRKVSRLTRCAQEDSFSLVSDSCVFPKGSALL